MRPRLFIALLLVASCSSAGSPTPDEASTTSTAVDTPVTTLPPGESASVIDGFSFSDPDAFHRLTDHSGDPDVVEAAGAALIAGVSGEQLWAAVYVWSNEGADPEPLVALLNNEEAAVRFMAATGLIARGRIEGFTTLIDSLTDESFLTGFEPPRPVWDAAATSLVRFTGIADNGPPFDADTPRLRLAQERWRAWFEANQARLTFDSEELLWRG
jgi:hypothetical protein